MAGAPRGVRVRDEARAEGRKIVDEARAGASGEVSAVLQQANEELTEQSRALTADCSRRWRPVGEPGEPRARGRRDDAYGARHNGTRAVAMSTFIGQLIGFAVIVFLIGKYVAPPVQDDEEPAGGRPHALAENAEAEKKVADADKEHAKALEEAKAEADQGHRGGAAGRREDRRAAARPGRRRAGADQNPRRTAGSAAAPAAHP